MDYTWMTSALNLLMGDRLPAIPASMPCILFYGRYAWHLLPHPDGIGRTHRFLGRVLLQLFHHHLDGFLQLGIMARKEFIQNLSDRLSLQDNFLVQRIRSK